jgi:carotenoid cleavage dioxygenase-like enzyme
LGTELLPKIQPVWEILNWDTDIYSTHYVRYRIDPVNEKMIEPPQYLVSNRNTEFPILPKSLSMKPYRYSYTAATHQEIRTSASSTSREQQQPKQNPGAGPVGAIMKVDTIDPKRTQSYSFLPHEFVGEPMFVAKVGANITDPQQEDHGYIIVYVLNGKDMTTDLVLLDVQGYDTITKGPIARIRLPTFIPHGLHGIFVEDLTFEF